MKLKLLKREDGTTDVVVYKTKRHENPTRAIRQVAPERVDEAIDRLVREVAGEPSGDAEPS